MIKSTKKKREGRGAKRIDPLPYSDSDARHAPPAPLKERASLILTGIHLLLLALLVFARGVFPIEAEDVFSNIVTGEYIWTHREVPSNDPFSFTGPHPWNPSRSLSQVLLYLAHAIDGLRGVQVLCLTLYAFAYCSLYLAWSRRTGRSVLSFVIVGLVIMASCYWFHPRTYAFGYLFFSLSTIALTSERLVINALVVPIIALWVNCHPSFILGLALTSVWSVVVVLRKRVTPRYAALIFIMSIGASALSAQGFGSLAKLYEEFFTPHPSRANIMEWLSPFSPMVSTQHLAWWFFGFCVVVACTFFGSSLLFGSLGSVDTLLPFSVVLFAVSLGCARHIPLFYISFVGLFISTVDGALRSRSWVQKRRLATATSFAVVAVTVAIICKTALYGYRNGETDRAFRFGIAPRKFPVRIFAMLKEVGVQGNIFTSYDTGSYFLYAMYPEYKVYLDGARLDEVYGEQAFYRYMEVGNSEQAMRDEISRYDLRSIVVPLPSSASEIVAAYNLFSSDPEWALAYFDDVHMLYMKRTEAVRSGIPVYRLLTPFAPLNELVAKGPEQQAALASDFEQGERLGYESLAFLALKARYQRLIGVDYAETVRRLMTFCARTTPMRACRISASQHLINLGAYWESRQVQ